MDVIMKQIRICFPKLKQSVAKKFGTDIYMVFVGIKPTFLIDTIAAHRNIQKIERLIHNLECILIENECRELNMIVMNISEDYFVVNLPLLAKSIVRERIYIDVSSSLQVPAPLSGDLCV